MNGMRGLWALLAVSCVVALTVAACGGSAPGAEPDALAEPASEAEPAQPDAEPEALEQSEPASGSAEHEGDGHDADSAVTEAPVKKTKKTKKKRRVPVALGAPTEFDLVPGKVRVKAGNVTFKLDNAGAIEHELIVIRTDLDSGALPTDADGAATEDGAVAPKAAGHADGEHGAHVGTHVPTGEKATVTVRLKPGKYALVCNLPGHYGAGMHANFKVVK